MLPLFLIIAATALAQVNIGAGVSIGGATRLPVVDISTQSGIDCTGTNDSSSGINTIFASLTGKKLVIPYSCTLKVSSQIVIQGQTGFSIEGEGFMPTQAGATPYIFGCSGAAGPVLYINRSSYWSIKNFGIYAKGGSCSSSFTGSIAWNNATPGGFTSTFAKIEGMSLETSTSGTAISNYVGIGIGIDGHGAYAATPNLEQTTIRDNYIHCQQSSGSYGIWMDGPNADNGSAINNRIDSCYQGIRQDQGNLKLVEKNHFDNDGSFSIFGVNGAAIFVNGCTSGGMNINANESSDGGPFLNMNDGAYTGACPVNMTGNYIGVSDLDAAAYPINLSPPSGGTAVLIGNQLFMSASTTSAAIGSSQSSNCSFGPLGRVIDIGNTINDITKVGAWMGCVSGATVRPYQSGEYHQFGTLGNKATEIEQAGTRPGSAATYAYPDVGPQDPTCGLVGHVWYDTTTTTTVMKVCLNVSGSLTWVTK